MTARKAILLFAGDNFISHLLLNAVVPHVSRMGLRPIVFLTGPSASPAAAHPALQHYGFYEKTILKDVIYPFIENAAAPSMTLSPEQLPKKYGATLFYLSSYDDECIDMALTRYEVKGALSIRNYRIFNDSFIKKIKSHGFFWNLHHGVLPSSRGLFLPFWNLLSGKQEHGCTLHDMETAIDAGDVIDAFVTPLSKEKSILHAYLDLVDGGADLVCSALDRYFKDGNISMTKQDQSQIAYYSFPDAEHLRKGLSQGIRLYGTPIEMLGVYTGLYGRDEVLAEKIAMAIMAHEGGAAAETQRDVVKAA